MADDDGGLPGPPRSDERAYRERRRVQLGDVDVAGVLRLDAASRYLQDVADDDATDAGLTSAGGPWVLRKAHLRVDAWPAFRDEVELLTWCSGVGACWAERRTRLRDPHDATLLESVAVWVHVDPASGRPRRPPEGFDAVYGGRAVSRRVDARLHLDRPPDDAHAAPWSLRVADVDVMGHVNNAAALAAATEQLAALALGPPMTVDLEYHGVLEPSPDPTVLVDHADGLRLWLRQSEATALACRVRPAA